MTSPKQNLRAALASLRKDELNFGASGGVAADRYRKAIREHEENRAESNYARSGLAGAGLGLLLRRKMGAGRAALTGAAAGLGTQAAVRAVTAGSKDNFGDRSSGAKRIEKVPWQAGAIAGGVLGYDKLANALGKVRKHFGFSRSVRLRVIRFSAASSAVRVKNWLALTGGIGAADAATSAVMPDDGQSRAQAAGRGLAKGLLYGGVLASAEPVIGSAVKRAIRGGLGSALRTVAASARIRSVVAFESRRDPEERLRDRLAIASHVAGIGAAGVGAAGAGYLTVKGKRVLDRVNDRLPGLIDQAKATLHSVKAAGDKVMDAGSTITEHVPHISGGVGQVASAVENSAIFTGRKKAAQPMRIAAKRVVRRLRKVPLLGRVFSAAGERIAFNRKDRDRTAVGVGGAIGGTGGLVAGASYRPGRPYRLGEDLTGKRVTRPLARFPLFQHEGIGDGHGKIIEVRHRGFRGTGTIQPIDVPKFGRGNPMRVIDHAADPAAANAARAAVGGKVSYCLLTNNCQHFTEAMKGRRFPVSRQMRQAVGGAIGGAIIGAGAAALLRRKREQSKGKALSARVRVIAFGGAQQLRGAGNRFVDPLDVASGAESAYDRSGAQVHLPIAHAQVVRAALNRGRSYYRYGSRGGALARDAIGAVRGEAKVDSRGRPVKREWEKSWFRNAVGTAAVGAGLLAHAHIMKTNPSYRAKVTGAVKGAKEQLNRTMHDLFPMSAIVRARIIRFDVSAPDWDVRDQRGRSARVFAPGSRSRERREKRWYERQGNQRLLLGGLAVAAGAGGFLAGHALGQSAGVKKLRSAMAKKGWATRRAAAAENATIARMNRPSGGTPAS